jgi:hypothetical protein
MDQARDDYVTVCTRSPVHGRAKICRYEMSKGGGIVLIPDATEICGNVLQLYVEHRRWYSVWVLRRVDGTNQQECTRHSRTLEMYRASFDLTTIHNVVSECESHKLLERRCRFSAGDLIREEILLLTRSPNVKYPAFPATA